MEPARRDSTGLSQKAECAPSRLRRFAEAFPEDCVLLDTPSPQKQPKTKPSCANPPPSTPPRRDCKRERSTTPVHDKPAASARGSESADADRPAGEAALVPHKQEDTEVAPATPPPESGVVEQAEGTRPRKRTKEQLRARKAEIKKLQTGSSIAKQLGIDFHANWLPKHNFHCDKRHWIQFQLALATSSLDQLNCALCTSMVEEAEVDVSTIQPLPSEPAPMLGDVEGAGAVPAQRTREACETESWPRGARCSPEPASL